MGFRLYLNGLISKFKLSLCKKLIEKLFKSGEPLWIKIE